MERSKFFFHDNVCSHTAAIIQQFLAKNGVAQLSHPLYSLYIPPPQYFVFPRLKLELKGDYYTSIKDSEICNSKIKNVTNF